MKSFVSWVTVIVSVLAWGSDSLAQPKIITIKADPAKWDILYTETIPAEIALTARIQGDYTQCDWKMIRGQGELSIEPQRAIYRPPARISEKLVPTELSLTVEDAAGQKDVRTIVFHLLDPRVPERKTDFPFSIQTNKTRYKLTERMTITLTAERACRFWIFHRDAEQHLALIVPNPLWRDNTLESGQTLTLPPPDQTFELALKEPTGQEALIAIAYIEPDTLTEEQTKGLEFRRPPFSVSEALTQYDVVGE